MNSIIYKYNGLTFNIQQKIASIISCSPIIPQYVLPSTITYNNKKYTITKISMFAFSNCNQLTTLKIPKSITTISPNAFSSCNALQKIEILGNIDTIQPYTFYRCKSLKTIKIPNTISTIKYMAFANCKSLEKITLPETISYIDAYAFYGCTKLNITEIPSTFNIIIQEQTVHSQKKYKKRAHKDNTTSEDKMLQVKQSNTH